MTSQQIVHMVICPSPKMNTNEQHKTTNYTQQRSNKRNDYSNFLKKMNEEKKLTELAKRNAQIPLSIESYDFLLSKLIERNQKYFTKEYGKNETDFDNYVRKTTNIYKLKDVNWISDLEKPFDLKKEIKAFIEEKKIPLVQLKKPKLIKKKQSALVIESKASIFTKESSGSVDDAQYAFAYPCKLEPFVYKLSDPEMMKRGITVEPSTMMPLKLFVFETFLTNPEISWFHHSGNLMYPNNTICSFKFPDGTGHLYSKDGTKSISFMNGTFGKMIIVFSSKKRHFDGKYEPSPLAIFDLIGNGVVYDEDGNKRLIYDQAQGVLFDTPSKIPLTWKWKHYESVIRRREELKDYRTDNLIDIEQNPYKIISKKDLKLPKGKGKKKDDKVFRKSSFEKHSLRNKSFHSAKILSKSAESISKRNKNKRLKVHLPSPAKEKQSTSSKQAALMEILKEKRKGKKHRTRSELVNTPAVLKFTEGGCCVIEPLLSPCSEELKQKGMKRLTKDTKIKKEHESVVKMSRKSRKFSKRVKERRRSMKATECFPAPEEKPFVMKISAIKPIILKISDTVSVTIMSQEHIHIDFMSHPIHYAFNVGVTVTSSISHVFASINPKQSKEIIPCFFEVLQHKCSELHSINQKLKQMREEAKNKLFQSQLTYLKTWGYNIYTGKFSNSNLLHGFNLTKKPCFCPCKKKPNPVIN